MFAKGQKVELDIDLWHKRFDHVNFSWLREKEEHDSHVLLVLRRLREHDLYAKMAKCSFDCKQVEYLGYVISSESISMDLAKVQTVLEWQTPRSLRDVQCFLGFTNFYHKFIQNYSKLILPLT